MTVLIDQFHPDAPLASAVLLGTQTRVGRMLAWRAEHGSVASFFASVIAVASAIRHALAPERAALVRRWVCYGDALSLANARMFAARRCSQELLADLLGWQDDPVLELRAPELVDFEVLDPIAALLCEPLSQSVRRAPLDHIDLSPDDALILLPGTDLAAELLGADHSHPLWRHVDTGGVVIGLSVGAAELAASQALFELFGDAFRQVNTLPLPSFESIPVRTYAWRLGARTRQLIVHPEREARIRDLLTLAWNQPIPDADLDHVGQRDRQQPLIRLLWGYWVSTEDGRLYRQIVDDGEIPDLDYNGVWVVATGHGAPLSVVAAALHPADPPAHRLQWVADLFASAGPMPRMPPSEVAHVLS
jgi:hypothetical protein